MLLRRVLLQNVEDLAQVDSAIIETCRLEMLEAIQVEENISLRRKICDAIAELARASIGMLLVTQVLVCNRVVLLLL